MEQHKTIIVNGFRFNRKLYIQIINLKNKEKQIWNEAREIDEISALDKLFVSIYHSTILLNRMRSINIFGGDNYVDLSGDLYIQLYTSKSVSNTFYWNGHTRVNSNSIRRW